MKKTVSLFMTIMMLFMSVGWFVPNAHAATKQELEEQINRIDAEIASNRNKLNSLAGQKKEKQEYLNTLEAQISATERKAAALETQIQTLDNEIQGYDRKLSGLKNEIAVITDEIQIATDEIKNTELKIEETKGELAEKLRTSYINGKQSTMKILMGAKNLASFLTRLEFMKRTSEDEKRVFEDFKNQVSKLEKAKKTLEDDKLKLDEKKKSIQEVKAKAVEKKRELTTARADYRGTISSLEKSYAEAESFIESLDKNSSVYAGYIKKLEDEKRVADAEIDEIIRRSMTTTTTPTTSSSVQTTLYASNNVTTKPATTSPSYSSNTSWSWPLGGASCYISSSFGNRSASISGWAFHGGIDITGGDILDKPVYASRGGTVIAAVKTVNYWKGGQGYGNYVVIDHGDGYATLYGHCYKINVASGQSVSKGQHIATVGSTGNSTGAHLHFEVRYNGVKQNPMNYVKK